jgi:hypothetical protein
MPMNLSHPRTLDPGSNLLLTDLYQLNMLQAYRDAGMTGTAVFEFFARKLPPQRGFLMAAGLEQVVEFLENARFFEDELQWLEDSGRFKRNLLDDLAKWRFTGDVHAMREGTVFFPDEPILRVTAPLPEAQLVETRIINLLHVQSLIASKAARMVLARPARALSTSGCAARTVPRPGCSPRGRATSPGSRARLRRSPMPASACRSSAPWRTRSFRRTTTRPPPFSTSPGRGRSTRRS